MSSLPQFSLPPLQPCSNCDNLHAAGGSCWVCDAEAKDTGKHYRYEYKGIKLDPYRIFKVYQITDGAQQHAIKKLLRAGMSVKPLRQDVTEARDTLNRWLEMMEEDGE